MISYKFKLYNSKKNKQLNNLLAEACFIWNRFLSIQKRYYKLYHKYASANDLQKHYAKRYKRKYLNSQSAQEVIQRLDEAYKRFFKHIAKRPPKFKKMKDFHSVVFKKSGYSINGNQLIINQLNKSFKFTKSRDINGNIKRISVKRSSLGEYYVFIITDYVTHNTYTKTHDGASVGVDFGLKTYLTLSDGSKVNNPLFLKRNLNKVKVANKNLSRKVKGSNHRKECVKHLCRLHEKVTNQREDFQWKLAHYLCKRFDYIFIEDLSIVGMMKLWGRKVSDLCHSSFISKLEHVSVKYGCIVHKIDRYYASSKLCDCGYHFKELMLNDRVWVCPECGLIHDRDLHAANNILRRGIYELESGSKTKVERCSTTQLR